MKKKSPITKDDLAKKYGTDDIEGYAMQLGDRKSSLRFYSVLRRVIVAVMWPYFRIEVSGCVENLNATGPLLLAPTHRSNLDPPIVAGKSARRMRALAKHTLYVFKPLGKIFARAGGIPVERGAADREALKVAERLLNIGEAMIVFPEGTRQSGPEIPELFGGVAYLAGRTSARVVPIAIAGTEEAFPPGAKWPRRGHVVVEVGEILEAPGSGGRAKRSEREEFNKVLRERLQELLDRANQRRAQRINRD